MTFKWHGDEFTQKLKRIQGKHEVPLSELFTDDFIQQNTDFQTLEAMLDASGVKSAGQIKGESFSAFIATRTKFASWDEMLKAGNTDHAKRTLNK